ncbi:MAG: hypothetical protein WCY88_17645 [Spongiibacteraceae bacterium]
MMGQSRVKAHSAGELLQHFELSEEGEAVAVLDTAPLRVINKLVKNGNLHDAVTLLAHALPKREAVWWACMATKATMDTQIELNVAAVAATELWVRSPTEPNRLVAKKMGERAKNKTAAGWAATAASWSAGSITDEGEAVAPPDYLYAHAVAASITLAAVVAGPEHSTENYHLFLRQGFNLANGGNGQVE